MDIYLNSLERGRATLHKIEQLFYKKLENRPRKNSKMYGNMPHARREKAREHAWREARSIFYHDEFSDPY